MLESTKEAADKRVQRSKSSVLEETYKMLSEGGIGGVSIDEISRRSGVAKTTIYRHWPSRSALLLDACSKIGARPEIPNSGGLEGDLTALAKHMAGQLESARWSAVLPSIIDAAERDPELAELYARLHADMMSPFTQVSKEAIQRGELPPDQSAADVAAAIVAPLFYRRWFTREPIDDAFVSYIVKAFIHQIPRI